MFLHYKAKWLMLYRPIHFFYKSYETCNYSLWVKCKVAGRVFSVVTFQGLITDVSDAIINQLTAVLFLAPPCNKNKRHLVTCLINFLPVYLQDGMTK